uniref:SCP domain-containing protein n=1 Tax=Meloidogyne javanica TaxID=6303 RepID=A0A915MQ10_MELJA
MKSFIIFLFITFTIYSTTFSIPIKDNDRPEFSLKNEENENAGKELILQKSKKASKNVVNRATCYDNNLATYINNGLYYYPQNMGQLSNYILERIKSARYSGYWFVHAAIITGQTQGLHWQSSATGDIFSPNSRHGCYYHDNYTYVVILKY